MKKLRKTIAAFAILAFGFGLMLNTQTSVAEEESLGSWICCQSDNGPGCTTFDGMYFANDIKQYATACTIIHT
jgi:hypothetical protein